MPILVLQCPHTFKWETKLSKHIYLIKKSGVSLTNFWGRWLRSYMISILLHVIISWQDTKDAYNWFDLHEGFILLVIWALRFLLNFRICARLWDWFIGPSEFVLAMPSDLNSGFQDSCRDLLLINSACWQMGRSIF